MAPSGAVLLAQITAAQISNFCFSQRPNRPNSAGDKGFHTAHIIHFYISSIHINWLVCFVCLYISISIISLRKSTSTYYILLPVLRICSSWSDNSSSWSHSDRKGTGGGSRSDPAAAGAMWAAGPAATDSAGSAKESLAVPGCFQHHYPALLSQGKI